MRLSLLFAVVMGTGLSAQITTDLVDKHKADFHTQATDPDMKREGGTQPRDWDYNLPEGVTTRQITFYVDGGTPLYGKVFFPKGFRAADRRPGVVVGHGINALSIGIEKYGARFAERGLVAMPSGQQAAMLDDAMTRARTGQGAEVDGGFSFRRKIDLFGNFRNRDVRPGAGFEVGSTLAAEWFLKYLAPSAPGKATSQEVRR